MATDWKAVEQYFFTWCCLFFNFTLFVILKKVSVLALLGVKEFTRQQRISQTGYENVELHHQRSCNTLNMCNA